MLARSGVVWFAIMVLAILNGAFRDVVLAPRLGELGGRAVSCVTLAFVILLVAWIALPWMKPPSMSEAWRIGFMWLGMTLLFEFGAGHYLFGTPWRALLADYNVFAGRLWVFVLIVTMTAPALLYAAGQNPVRDREISLPAADGTSRP